MLTITELEPRHCPAPLPVAFWESATLVEVLVVTRPFTVVIGHVAVVPDPVYPPVSTATVRSNSDAIPAGVANYLTSVGYAVNVYADGRHLTDLPRFADLRGVLVYGDPQRRTWDTITAATSDQTYLTPEDASRVVRESGIALYNHLTRSEVADWLAVWRATRWDDPVQAGSAVEAFADSFAYFINGRDVGGFFARLDAERGW